jgi:hypothetical protein
MARYADDYGRRYGAGRRQGRSYDGDFGYAREFEQARNYGYGRDYGYGAEFMRGGRAVRLPHKPAYGYPVHGIHTYDLDYGSLGGPTTDYSGRVGYPILPMRAEEEELPPRGPYTPSLEESGRGRTLYGGVPPTYRGQERARPREWRRRR